jgi:hypothetical protein
MSKHLALIPSTHYLEINFKTFSGSTDPLMQNRVENP